MSTSTLGIELPHTPFDAVAEGYDQGFTFSNIGRAQRSAVWRELRRTFHAGDRVLEIGCGTGVDACFLAERGVKVVACDNSPAMIQVAVRRVREMGTNAVDLRLLAAENLAEVQQEAPFDGVFSNFGALNCVEDLKAVGEDLGRLLKPGRNSPDVLPRPIVLLGGCLVFAQSETAQSIQTLALFEHHCGTRARVARSGALLRHSIIAAYLRTVIAAALMAGDWTSGSSQLR